MMLEDFFTLTEMKDGLTATSRIEELVAVMQKEKDCIVNPADAIRQWTVVASIIATTDYKDCLDHFVQLGGLLFIDRWLKDAENFGSNNGDNFVEKSITALLVALERLCIDKDKSISSGIWITVGHLLDHHNAKVQDRARAVFDNWNHGDRGNDAVCQQMENGALVNDGASVSKDVGRQIGETEYSMASVSSCGEKEDVESYASEAIRVDNLPLQSSNATIPERVEDVQKKHHQNQLRSKMVLDTCNESFDSLLSSAAMSGHDQDGTSDDIKDVQMYPSEETTRVETCGPDVPCGNSFSKDDTVPVNVLPEDMKPVDKLNSGQEYLSSLGATRAFELANVSEADALTSEEIAAVSSAGTKVGVDVSNICTEAASVSDLQVSAAEPQIEMAEVPTATEDNDCCFDTAKNSPDKRPISEKLDDLDNSHLSKEVGAAAKCKETVKDRFKEVSNLSALYGGRRGNKHSNKARGKRSTIQLEYSILDALDIARQVAKEVEREVTDYKEPFSSTSSERSSGGRIGESRSPCSSADSSSGEVSTGQSQSAKGDGRSSTRSGNGDSEAKDLMKDVVVSSQMTEVKVNTEKGFCEFDLNEEVCSDDGGNKTLLNEEFGNSSSQGLKRLEIDLNMAKDGEDGTNFHVTENNIPVSSNVNSKGFSVEANQGRSERFNLDLNSSGDGEDVVISDSHHFNGRVCKSPASSSSQMQPHKRNFDLNDQPYSSFNDSFSDQALYHNSPSLSGMILGNPTLDPFISIMGTKVQISRDDLVPQRSSYLHNGKGALEASSGGVLGLGPTVSSLYSPLTRCSTLPTGHAILFSMASYGPNDQTHCVIDPQGGPILSGAPGPTPALYPPYPVPFMMSLNTGPPRPQFDLNSGVTVDGANQDPRFLMQLFPPSQVKSTAEYSGAFFQPFSGSIIGAKRKEPEGRLEPYPIVGRQHQSPGK